MAGIVTGWKWGEFRRQAAPGSFGHLQREWLCYEMKHIDTCDQNYILKDQSVMTSACDGAGEEARYSETIK